MQYLAICEDDLLFQFMRNVSAKQGEVLFLVQEEEVAKRIRRQGGKVRRGDLLREETYRGFKLQHIDQVILFVREAEFRDRICRLLRNLDSGVSIVSLTPSKNGARESEDGLFTQLQLADVFEEFCSSQLLDT
ncbi:MAG TPA: NAD-binding protein, partial [Candidatus Acidoferrales bacterium]|nr:NAD-binding protein [Candidatus Acidoferrales bacterium]